MIYTQAGLATQRDRAGRKRLAAFRQSRRVTRLVLDRLRRVSVMIAGRGGFMVRSGSRTRWGAVFDARGIRPGRAQVEQRRRKNQCDEATKSHELPVGDSQNALTACCMYGA